MKPEAVFEVEFGRQLSAYDISAASRGRTAWYQAVRRLFETYDYGVLPSAQRPAPSAQLFAFDVDLDWPHEVAGQPMRTYHEWMQVAFLVTMSGCPALAAPAGFSRNGLPIGNQIVGPNQAEMACLLLAHAYDRLSRWVERRLPPLLGA
jgi:amidase